MFLSTWVIGLAVLLAPKLPAVGETVELDNPSPAIRAALDRVRGAKAISTADAILTPALAPFVAASPKDTLTPVLRDWYHKNLVTKVSSRAAD